MAAPIRLQKYLSQAGAASRRRSEALIADGRVRVNGVITTELGTRVDPDSDIVELDGRRVRPAAPEWYALHKPAGYLSTRDDPQRRPTLYALLPRRLRRLFYIGRLDLDSEGLILLTNEGDVAHRLMHPRYGIEREYEVLLAEEITDDDLHTLTRGVSLEDGPARAERARRLSAGRVLITLREGRKREVRRMLAALGHTVVRLKRVRYGPIRLDRLGAGAWRALTPQEIAALRVVTDPETE